MKKNFVILFLTGALLFSGCEKESTPNQETKNEAQQEAVKEEAKEQEQKEPEIQESETQERETQEPETQESEKQEPEIQESQEPETEEKGAEESFSFADVSNMGFTFASGAGAWSTELSIGEDGSFEGKYFDADMGDTGDGYPRGTVYYCGFKGKFTPPVQVDAFTYKFQIEEMSYANPVGTEEIKDEVRYEYSDAYGLNEAEDFYMYLPGTSFDKLSDEMMRWLGTFGINKENGDKLDCYALYNVTPQYGFAGYEGISPYELAMESLDSAQATDDTLGKQLETEALNQIEMNDISRQIYEAWDNSLNYIWSLIKENLSEEEYEKLLNEQRSWIEEKEQKVKEAGAECEGGSMQPLLENGKAAELTRERAYELVEYLSEE